MRYRKLNENSGEFVLTEIQNLRLPNNLGTPDINGVERTVNVRLSRASGWHYDKGEMLFTPSYTGSRGAKMPFNISVVKTKGFKIELESKSPIFEGFVPLGVFFAVCFPYATLESLYSLILSNDQYLTKEFFSLPKPSDIPSLIVRKRVSVDPLYAVDRFRTLFTRQTQVKDGKRLKSLLSLEHFVGCKLKEDTLTYSGILTKGLVLTSADVFALEHSGLTKVSLVTPNGHVIQIPLLSQAYVNLANVKADLNAQQRRHLTQLEDKCEPFRFGKYEFNAPSIPLINTLQVYCMIVNRLINFKHVGVSIDMNSYENQVISTIEDEIAVFDAEDTAILDDRIVTAKSMLSGVSTVQFDQQRLFRAISGEESSLVVLKNNENPFALIASSGGQKLVKPVKYLEASAIGIREASLGVEDGSDIVESKNIGKSSPMCVTTEIIDQKLKVPLFVIRDKVNTKEVVYVDATDLNHLCIGECNCNLSDKYVLARIGGETRYVRAEEITHIRVSPYSSTSVCRGSAVYLNHSDLKRSQMAAKTAEQARNILMPERALIETGIESVGLIASENAKFYKTVREIFLEFLEAESLGAPPDWWEDDDYILTQLMDNTVDTLYKIEARSSPDFFATFSLRNETTAKGSCTWFNIVPSRGTYYRLDDIIIRHNNVLQATEEVEGAESLEYHSKGDPHFFDMGIGCGKNFTVMFGFFHSLTVDDASLISDQCVLDMSMDTPVITVKKYFKQESNPRGEERFGFLQDRPEGFTEEGLPTVGTYISNGAPIIYKYIRLAKSNKVVANNFCLEPEEAGEVQSVVEDEKMIVITLYRVVHIRVSDKLGGRHGNKTTVAKVLPREQMYYDLETGEPIDLVLNPLSIASRMNSGQVIEMFNAAKQSKKGGIRVDPIFNNYFETCVKEHMDVQDLTMRTIVDARTGRVLPNKMFVGKMYIVRSVHLGEDKATAIGDSKELDLGFLQPTGRGPQGQRGQSVGAYETDLLIAKNCPSVVDETRSILSSDVNAYKDACDAIKKNGISYLPTLGSSNLNLEHFLMITLSLYVHADKEGTSFHMRFATDDILRGFREIPLADINNALTDKQLCKEITYFRFNEEIITPIALEKFNCGKIITVYKIGTNGYEMKNLTKSLASDIINSVAWVRESADPDLELDMFYIDFMQIEDATTGMEALVNIFKRRPVSYWRQLLERRQEIALENTSVFSTDFEELINLCSIIESTGGLTQFISTLFPVMPYQYRTSSMDSRVDHDITRGYKSIASLCLPGVSSGAKSTQIYNRLKQVLIKVDSEYKSVFEFLFHKDTGGRVRRSILKTRVKNSMRANIAPMEYGHPDIIGLPIYRALYIFQPYVNAAVRAAFPNIEYLNLSEIGLSHFLASILRLPLPEVRRRSDGVFKNRASINKLENVIREAINGRCVMYNRAPALHETSLWGGLVTLHKDDVIRLHTLLTAEQNADFDGDQEPVMAPLTKQAIKEVHENLLPSTRLFRSNDGEVSLRINQDALLGLYLSTIDEPDPNVEPRIFASVHLVREALNFGWLNLSDVVIVADKTKVLRTTAGRLAISYIVDRFDFLVPDEEDGYYKPLIDKPIVGKNQGDSRIYINNLVRKISAPSMKIMVDRITELQKFGYEACSLYNLTMSPSDFAPAFSVDVKEEQFIEDLQSLGTLEDYGLLPDNWHQTVNEKITSLKKNLNIKERLGKDNAFYKIVDSGAKGGNSQLENMFGMIGLVKGNKGFLPTPILSGYIKGLSQFQSEDMTYEQRMNAVSTVLETSRPGVSLRTGSFELSGLQISRELGGKIPYDHRLFYQWDDALNTSYKVVDRKGQEVGNVNELTYRGIRLISIIHQLKKSPYPVIPLDQEGVSISFKREIDSVLDDFLKNKLNNRETKIYIASSKKCYNNAPIRSFVNYFEQGSTLAKDYAGRCATTNDYYEEGSKIGIKASTATSEPANQMVISRRNLVASDVTYNSLGIFQQAIQYGKMFSDNKANISIVAPEDGVITIQNLNAGTLLILKAFSGNVYQWFMKVDEEDYRVFHINDRDFVFATQILSSIKGASPDSRIHPTLSMTWDSVTINDVVYKNILPNPSAKVIQFARFTYFKFLSELYKESGINLDYTHFVCYSLQQLRTVEVIRRYDDTYKGTKFVSVAEAINSYDKALFNFYLMSGKETILTTSGPLAAYTYQDPMASVSSAFSMGKVEEVGYIGDLVLGVQSGQNLKDIDVSYKSSRGTCEIGVINTEASYNVVFGDVNDLKFEEPSSEGGSDEGGSFDFSELFGEYSAEDDNVNADFDMDQPQHNILDDVDEEEAISLDFSNVFNQMN